MTDASAWNTDVVDVEFAATHPELHHYTDRAGLSGILASNRLWATRFRDLNDSTEAQVIRDPLCSVLSARFFSILRRRRQETRVRRALQKSRQTLATAARETAIGLVGSFYKVTFAGTGPLEPYIVSFCTHADDF